MKIKEVIAQTGLTDRAIRLYITSGLVAPQCQKSYAGRNNYSFSEADVLQLEKIALLRKAEFSLVQIKRLQQENAAIAPILTECLIQKRMGQKKEQAVIDALEELCAVSAPTLDMVCFKLSDCFQKPLCLNEEEPPPKEEPWWRTALIYIGIFLAATIAIAATAALLFYGLYNALFAIDIYETTSINDYLEIKGNYDNETPEAFIRSFFPEEIDDSFSQLIYHYKAKKLDAYAYECYLEFVIEDPDAYRDFIDQYVDEQACTTFLYDGQFREQSISNVLMVWQSQPEEAVYQLEQAELGKILFSDEQQRVIFIAIGMYDGGGTDTVELGHFWNRFQIDPWEYSRSAFATGYYQEKGITNEELDRSRLG